MVSSGRAASFFGVGKLIILYNEFGKTALGRKRGGRAWRRRNAQARKVFVVHNNAFCDRKGDVSCSGRRPDDSAQVHCPGDCKMRGGRAMTTTFDSLAAGDAIAGPKLAVTRESVRHFCDAPLDDPLHPDESMKGSAGKTNFGLISRMITDWAYPAGAVHRRLETHWVKPVKPGDLIQPSGTIKAKQSTAKSRWVLIDVVVRNQHGEKVATGEAMVEFPMDLFCQ
jgi:3-hydroxybutyryl-CoA dehydratase